MAYLVKAFFKATGYLPYFFFGKEKNGFMPTLFELPTPCRLDKKRWGWLKQ
jgi:hypothetical protein